ncbi:ATP-binding cassette domain-containing protein [Alishewanella sp. 16-MA]|uniref:ATP-binding cassette domain-containing protein n=1 Tax=Alishewanella maricola TaxID=2795740 RepID=A0ABS8C392_9ALTE|nr:ATP-binding cassette domain-containing protein [Alishewanella maricola]MCB5226797.1 ATP-binding cassette domain-containing protein [Alishewanella maricola]
MNSGTLQINALQLSRQQQPLLSLSTEIPAGEVLTVMGPSGSGKSSLLNWLSGLLAPQFSASGQIVLDGKDITHLPAHQRHMGLLLQDPLLFPHLTVAENIAFAMPKAIKGAQRQAQILAALDSVGLADMALRNPASLSGGQQARVALLRVMLAQPKALLLDEPFSKLDSRLRQEVRELVFNFIQLAKIPALLVTHDQADVPAAGRVINLAEAEVTTC